MIKTEKYKREINAKMLGMSSSFRWQ